MQNIKPAEYVRTLCLSGATKAILIKNNGRQELILVQEGVAIYAGLEALKGEEAYAELLSWRGGVIKEVKIKKFPKPNIDGRSRELLLASALVEHEDIEASQREFSGDGDRLAAVESSLGEPAVETNNAVWKCGVKPGGLFRRWRENIHGFSGILASDILSLSGIFSKIRSRRRRHGVF